MIRVIIDKFWRFQVRKMTKDTFNPAFKDLFSRLKNAPGTDPKPDFNEPEKVNPKPSDEEYFLEAMSDVMPLSNEKSRVTPDGVQHVVPTHRPSDDEQQGIDHLHALVSGAITMDISFSDEYMEGAVRGISRKIMKRLKRGQFPYRDYVDLHGLSRHEAEKRVKEFLLKSHKFGHRCVLIVHGRGLNSPDSFPVLKEMLPRWLNSGPLRKIVLAFATARPYDGGTGAVYVLLKRR
jgi:DNA-nicking Smr family endonuclease